MPPIDPLSFLIVSAATFAGAVVSGLAGFAFSAVAGAILLHVLPPAEAVPLMMACSIVTQAVSLVSLRGTVKWHVEPTMIAGGAVGLLPALYLLHNIDAHVFRIGFGIFLVAYAAYMLMRRATADKACMPSRLRHAMIGFGGGLIGGLTAMPGAMMAVWCDLRGLPKAQKRALSQPYVLAMQVIALALMIAQHTFSSHTLVSLTYSLPALFAGAARGVLMFRRVNDAHFRSAVLGLLLFGGVGLVM
ncbi:MAG TPA: sulfite exporter TauE/SafE family protein [Pseudolabrys sp.]|nr:sulfite exporter TauE/SafE family protein [Pseudolabrys sp.]